MSEDPTVGPAPASSAGSAVQVQAPPGDTAKAAATPSGGASRRGSWLPGWPLITTKHLELRKHRGLMAAVLLLTVGLPVIVLGIRLLFHLIAPHSYGPAGSPSVFAGLTGPMAEFGFIIAATLGATAGTSDLADGVFRHLVVTGRSRIALYLARLPAGLAIVLPLVAAAFAVLCLVTAFAGSPQPTTLNENGVSVPLHLDQAQLEHWLLQHPQQALQAFPVGPLKAQFEGQGGAVHVAPAPVPAGEVPSLVRHRIADIYSSYTNDELTQLVPASNEMAKIGLWLELEVAIGFIVGLGLGSLIGQRTVAAILMIALEIIITPILVNVHIPYFVNGQRLVVGVAMDQLRPAGLATTGGRRIFGGHAALGIPPMPTWAMISVIVGWIVGWTVIGAWRMATRDA
jgi:hypothetical protein